MVQKTTALYLYYMTFVAVPSKDNRKVKGDKHGQGGAARA